MGGRMGHMGGGPGRAGGRQNNEKIARGTWGKLLNYCRKYWAAILIAMVCSAGGTILTLAGPDKLSEITDVVAEGIAPDAEKLAEITEAMAENLSANAETVMTAIAGNLMPVSDLAQQPDAPQPSDMTQPSDVPQPSDLAQLPQPEEIEVNGVTIPVEDQMTAMELFGSVTVENETAEAAELLEELPETVKNALYTDITVDGVTIGAEDQREMSELLSGIDREDADAALEAFDALPASVYGLIKPSVDMDRVVEIAVILVTLYVIGAVLSATQGWVMSTVTQMVSKKLRNDISEKINRLPMSYYHHNSTGDVLSRVTNDVDTIGMSLNMSVGMLVSAVTLFAGSLIMMLKTNLTLTGTGVLATAVGFVLMMAIMGRSQKYFTRQQKHLGAINGHIEEIYSGHTVVKAYNGEEAAKDEFDRLNGRLRDSGFKAQALSGLMMPIMTFIGNFGYVAVCVTGAALALDGKISFGVIVSFIMYIRYFTQPLSQIAQAAQSLQSAGAAASRVFEFLDAEEMADESEKTGALVNTRGDVSFSHVRFGYDPGKIIINDFSADAKAGQKVAIVGPTGAGKTTLVNLLMRFYEINSGEIRIDGIPTSNLKREEVHAQFCMVLQDTWLFAGTVRENLVYCSENNSEEKMKDACRAVGLDHFIRTLPKGYDTVLDDQVNLSQGQKQQLTIARAMIADKPILILDEATSSIDTRTEQKIQQAMDELMKGRTSFVIAHRLSTIKNADLILVLKDGDVIESGNHEELMRQNGFYAELYNSQFEQAS